MKEKRLNKIAAFLLILILSVSLLNGCGESTNHTQELEETAAEQPNSETTDIIKVDTSDFLQKDLSVTYKHSKFQVKLSTEHVYLGDKLEVSISSDKDISEIYYLILNKDPEQNYIDIWDEGFYFAVHGSAPKVKNVSLDSPQKEVGFWLDTKDIDIGNHEIQIAAKIEGERKTRGIAGQLHIIPKPDIKVTFDKNNWESEQKIQVTTKEDEISNVFFVDENGKRKEFSKKSGNEFELNMALPPPDNKNNTLEFVSKLGLVSKESISTNLFEEERIFFGAIRKDESDAENIKHINCIASNNLDGNDFKVEFDIPEFKFSDDNVESYYEISYDKVRHIIENGRTSFIVQNPYLFAISPDKNYFLFGGGLSFILDEERELNGKVISKVGFSRYFIYHKPTESYNFIDGGSFFWFTDGAFLNNYNIASPIKWLTDTKLMMLRLVQTNDAVYEMDYANDPNLKVEPIKNRDPGRDVKAIILDVQKNAFIDAKELDTPKELITLSDTTNGITGWIGFYDSVNSRVSPYRMPTVIGPSYSPFVITDIEKGHSVTIKEICNILKIPETSSTVEYVGSTNYGGKPRAILAVSGHKQYYKLILFNIERKEADELLDFSPTPSASLNIKILDINTRFSAINSCSRNPETPVILISDGKIYKITEADERILESEGVDIFEDSNISPMGRVFFIK